MVMEVMEVVTEVAMGDLALGLTLTLAWHLGCPPQPTRSSIAGALHTDPSYLGGRLAATAPFSGAVTRPESVSSA